MVGKFGAMIDWKLVNEDFPFAFLEMVKDNNSDIVVSSVRVEQDNDKIDVLIINEEFYYELELADLLLLPIYFDKFDIGIYVNPGFSDNSYFSIVLVGNKNSEKPKKKSFDCGIYDDRLSAMSVASIKCFEIREKQLKRVNEKKPNLSQSSKE